MRSEYKGTNHPRPEIGNSNVDSKTGKEVTRKRLENDLKKYSIKGDSVLPYPLSEPEEKLKRLRQHFILFGFKSTEENENKQTIIDNKDTRRQDSGHAWGSADEDI